MSSSSTSNSFASFRSKNHSFSQSENRGMNSPKMLSPKSSASKFFGQDASSTGPPGSSASKIFGEAKKKLSDLSSSNLVVNAKQKLSAFNEGDLMNQAKEKSELAMKSAVAVVGHAKEKVKNTVMRNHEVDETDIKWTVGPAIIVQQEKELHEASKRFHPHTSWSSLPNLPAYAESETQFSALGQNLRYSIVIIGFGVAGGYAAKILAENHVEQVCIIGAEAQYAYERPALSKGYMFKSKPAARLPKFHCGVAQGGICQDYDFLQESGILDCVDKSSCHQS